MRGILTSISSQSVDYVDPRNAHPIPAADRTVQIDVPVLTINGRDIPLDPVCVVERRRVKRNGVPGVFPQIGDTVSASGYPAVEVEAWGK